jgi:carbamoyltransferase
VASLDEEFNILIGVDKQYIQKRIHKIEHRHSHLASAFFASPFKEAALLSIDG